MAKNKFRLDSQKNIRLPAHKRHFSITQKIILSVIILSMILVTAVTICSFIFTPENLVKSKLNAIASDYYENYIFQNLLSSKQYANINDTEKALSMYNESGLAAISMRQLLLSNNGRYSHEAPFLTQYCNEEKTSVKIFPEPPYSASSYRLEFIYSCNF